jgi:hypothetical protein
MAPPPRPLSAAASSLFLWPLLSLNCTHSLLLLQNLPHPFPPVPVLLSLGVGVMRAQKQKRLAMAVLKDAAVKKSEGGRVAAWGWG